MPMKKVLLRSTLLTVCLLLLATIALIGSWFMATAPPAAVVIEIEAGANLSQIAHRLEERGVLRSAMALKLLARLRHQSNAIHTGRYRFDGSSDPIEILARLVSGDVEQASLTIPEGFTLQQIAERIGQQHLGDPKRFLVLSRDRSFLTSLGISAENLEGYLFPETYRFKPGIGEEALIRIMVQQLSSRLDDTTLKAAQKVKLNRHQLLTLASIIEKETAQVTEMPLISSVFHNRLERGIPLQTDPTVIYGIADFDGNLTRKHLSEPTPYNTYRIKGLPPGPIASPGLRALQAAANPASTDFLYFVARGDGTHAFSKTLSEHNRAVRRYQLKKAD